MHRTARLGQAIALALLLLLDAPAAPAADKELLDVLLSNGAITQAQYEELLEKERLTQDDMREVLVSLDGKGLRIRRRDEAFSFRIGGRLHTDVAGHWGSSLGSLPTDGTEIRRARMYLKGALYEDYFFAAETDFADDRVRVKDFLVGYSGFSWGKFSVGHQKQPFSLAIEMSSNDLPFISRGVDAALLAPFVDRAIGVRGDFAGEQWHVAAGFYGDSLAPDLNGDEGWGASARGVWAPLRSEERVLHLGLRGAVRNPDDGEIRIRAESTHFSNLFLAFTPLLEGIDNVYLFGPEAAFAVGPFSVGGEYNHAWIDGSDRGDLGFESWHVEATWSLTGESRAAAYSMGSGEFKGLRPARNFSLRDGDWGAWELAARYATLDLRDGSVDGGQTGVLTVGLNWYLNPSIRLMLDWSNVLVADLRDGDAEGLHVLRGRVDFHF